MFSLLPAVVAVAILSRDVLAVGTPFGHAAGTTGGGSLAPAVPSSLAQLATWLSDGTARVILLDKVFDFSGADGTSTGTACAPWNCSPNPQLAIDANGWCGREQPNAPKSTVTYNVAGTKPLKVGNNKTLLGKGSNSGLKGKGLILQGSQNVIIQNIKITDINPRFVWGGDALQIDGGSRIWIDHNYFQNIGRQMVVTGYGSVTATTFSNNVFNGETSYSTGCNGQHYWVALFTGTGDRFTFAQNYLYKTSGRGPHMGGTSGKYQSLHLYNNYFVSIAGHAFDADVGSKALAEGNYFNTVTTPVTSGKSGQAFMPLNSGDAGKCSQYIGRSCVINSLTSSGSASSGQDAGAAAGFTSDNVVKSARPRAAAEVPAYVQANAGVGKVN